jgi:hypothetical protein
VSSLQRHLYLTLKANPESKCQNSKLANPPAHDENASSRKCSVGPLVNLPTSNIVLDEKSQTLNSPLGVKEAGSARRTTVSLSNTTYFRILGGTPDASCEVPSALIRSSEPVPTSLLVPEHSEQHDSVLT